MSDLVRIGVPQRGKGARRPEWLRVKVQGSDAFKEVDSLVAGLKLHTVCESARCPNIWECWGGHKTATSAPATVATAPSPRAGHIPPTRRSPSTWLTP